MIIGQHRITGKETVRTLGQLFLGRSNHLFQHLYWLSSAGNNKHKTRFSTPRFLGALHCHRKIPRHLLGMKHGERDALRAILVVQKLCLVYYLYFCTTLEDNSCKILNLHQIKLELT